MFFKELTRPSLAFYIMCYVTCMSTSLSLHSCAEGAPLPGPKSGLLSNTWNELSEETHVLTKQEALLGKGAWAEGSRVREPRRTALPCGSQSWVLR